VVTTGTRDVQLRYTAEYQVNNKLFEYSVPGGGKKSVGVTIHQDHPGTLLLGSMRNGCLQLAKDYSLISEHLLLPLIEPAVRYVLEKDGNIDLLLFIVTNQENENVHSRFIEKDTLNLPALAEKHLTESFPGKIKSFDTYEVYERITDIDFWYERFEAEFKKYNLIEELQGQLKVWFMPQGGLDQVNQALTLRFIEHYPGLSLIQIAEECEPRELEFPKKFLHNLTRAKALEMAKYFRFSQVLALNLSQNKEINFLAELGETMMRLDHSTLVSMSMREPWLSAKKRITAVRKIFETLVNKPDPFKLNMWLYLTAKVNAWCGNAEELLWRLYTLHEQILKPFVAGKLQWGNPMEDKPFRDFNRCVGNNRDLLNFLNSAGRKEQFFVPGPAIFDLITRFFRKQGETIPEELKRISGYLKLLKEERHLLIHQGRGIGMKNLEGILDEKANISLETLFEKQMDPFYGVSGFGLIGDLQDELISRL